MNNSLPLGVLGLPLVLRLSGLWLIWTTWASSSGWLLSAAGALTPTGYLLSLPILLAAWFLWWKKTRHPDGLTRPRFCLRRPLTGPGWLKASFLLVAALSLAAAIAHIPWSFDAVTYRMPRCLYWLAEQRWYWIGTLDGRIDYSSCGLEWQMIPIMLLTGSDRFLFLLSYIPFLLLPGLTYLAGRALGCGRRPMLVWMWLLPCAYNIALQCSGLQNDGYTASYTAACIAFGWQATSRRSVAACVLSGLAAALLTGAKLSNLPLMLPLGIIFLVAAWKSGFYKHLAALSLLLMALVSFLPLAVLALKHTGHWTGDPHDQWGFRTGNPIAAMTANLVLAGNDLIQPPLLVGTGNINAATDRVEEAVRPAMQWMSQSHRMFRGLGFGDMVYEGGAGPGFSIGCFVFGGIIAGFCLRSNSRRAAAPSILRWAVLGSGIVAWLILLTQLGSGQSARNSAPFLPLLAFTASGLPPFKRFLYSRCCAPMALLGILSLLPIIILTPARPLMPISFLEGFQSVGSVSKVLIKYRMWETLRDDLKPLREKLPADQKVIGYAGAFRDTSYGLWKPFGSRTLPELGVPLGIPARHAHVPKYVVATDRGIRERFGVPLGEWMLQQNKKIGFSFPRSTSLEGDERGQADEWFLLEPN